MEPSNDFNNNDRAAGSGFALLSAYEWLDVAACQDFYAIMTLRFASGALNRSIHRHTSTLPLRVIAGLLVGYAEREGRCWAHAYKADLETHWPDLLFENHSSPESLLRDVFVKCRGLVLNRLLLRTLPYNQRVMAVLTECLPFVTVPEVFIDDAAIGDDQLPRVLEIVPGLRDVRFNNTTGPEAADVLSVCAARNVHKLRLIYANDVTDAEMLGFVFNGNSARISRLFRISGLQRPLSDSFFEIIVEKCRSSTCESLNFRVGAILTDPADAKFDWFIVERDESATLYKFDAIGQMDLPFTVIVGKPKFFYLTSEEVRTHVLHSL